MSDSNQLREAREKLQKLEKENMTLLENISSLERALSFTAAHRDTLQKQLMNLLKKKKQGNR